MRIGWIIFKEAPPTGTRHGNDAWATISITLRAFVSLRTVCQSPRSARIEPSTRLMIWQTLAEGQVAKLGHGFAARAGVLGMRIRRQLRAQMVYGGKRRRGNKMNNLARRNGNTQIEFAPCGRYKSWMQVVIDLPQPATSEMQLDANSHAHMRKSRDCQCVADKIAAAQKQQWIVFVMARLRQKAGVVIGHRVPIHKLLVLLPAEPWGHLPEVPHNQLMTTWSDNPTRST